MTALKQILAVTRLSLSTLPQRRSSALVVIVGIASVVGVLITILAMSTGILKALNSAGRDDRAVVVRNGAAAEVTSSISREAASIIMDAPGVKRAEDGTVIGSPETVSVVNFKRKGDGGRVMVPLRGVGSAAMMLRPELTIVQGRMFRPALNEVVIGRAASAQFDNAQIGDTIKARGASWTIVGVFAGGATHSARESEILADVTTIQSIYKRNSYQSVTVMLESLAAFAAFRDALTANPALDVDVYREPDLLQRQSRTYVTFLKTIALVLSSVMAIGAVFAAMNTMYSAVSARIVEIATLRAIGFSSAPIAVSVLLEAILLGVFGALLGALATWLLFNGRTLSTNVGAGGGLGGQLVFDLTVTAQLVGAGLLCAILVGFVGGLLPAMRAVRMPIVQALRAD